MVVPTFCEGVKGLCQTWKEDIVDTKQMYNICQMQQAIFLETVKNFIVKVCHADPDISPQALYSRSETGLIQLKRNNLNCLTENTLQQFIILHLTIDIL